MKSFKEYLNEAKIDGKNRIELESIAGGITVYASESGYFGNDDQSWFEIKGYSYSPEPIFYKDIPAEFISKEGVDMEYRKKFKKESDDVIAAIKKACDHFEKEINDIMKSRGYKLKK